MYLVFYWSKKSQLGILQFYGIPEFGIARGSKTRVSIYKKRPRPQNVRIWRPLAPNWPKDFFEFLEELGNSKHFQAYFIFSPNWRSGARQWRQVAKLAKNWELRVARTCPI